MFCSVPKVLFTRWAGFFFLFLCTTHPTTNAQHPSLIPCTSGQRRYPLTNTADGRYTPRTCRQTNACGNTPTHPVPSALQTPPVSQTPATGHSTLVPSLARPAPPTRRATAGHTDAGSNAPRQMATASRTTPAAIQERPSPPDTPAAGLANSGGGPVTAICLPCLPPPPTRRAAAGHTNAGGNPPRAMSAPIGRHRSCQRRRRSRS